MRGTFMMQAKPNIHSKQYFGKYKGSVVKTQGMQVQVTCKEIYGEYDSPWCEACVPYIEQHEQFIKVPPVGTMVWIEFQQGDPTKPIWCGVVK